MELELGLRVVRGPDWKWGDQDGGIGGVGTVAEVSGGEVGSGNGTVTGRAVIVQWDSGNRCNYRCGVEGKYDLKVFDTAQTGHFHENIICDSCREQNIPGMRWKCTRCYDFDLCTLCYYEGKHSLDHEFNRIDKNRGKSVRVPARNSAKKIAAQGIFPNAEVVRGHDWIWGDQDGGLGKTGKVVDIKKWANETYRSVVQVEWTETGKKNVYRLGHKGKVDVKCIERGIGGYYYPEQLPTLGAPYEETPPEPTPQSTHTFSSGDRVKVQLEVEVFKMMQEGHGGWNDQMATCLSEVGSVVTVLDSGDLRVRFPSNHLWTLNADAVVKVNGDDPVGQVQQGDVVRVLDDIARVHNLQENHGGWVDDMALALGQVGRVVRVFPTGDLRVGVNGRTWTFNPQCVAPAPGENPPEAPASELDSEDLGLHLKLLSLLENPAVIVAAAAAGDVHVLKEFLTKHPHEVNSKAAGKAAIHCASVAGNIPMLKAILEFAPDLEVEDEDGDRPLHLCAYGDEDEAAQLLIDAGANVNSKNHKGATPLLIAAVKGHHSVLRKLANHPNIRLHEQDSDGDTALHCAVLAQKNESVSILLECGTDPTLLNFRLFTPIHEAARIGFLPAVEQFIRKHPQQIDLRKDDGYTSLHLASLNDHLDVVTTLAELDFCEINAKTNMGQTALHLAVHQGNSKIVERLIGFGINLNLQDNDGDTALHIAMMRETVDTLSAETPQLRKIRDGFALEGETATHKSATVACFLVQEGADVYLPNKKGHTPLHLCSPDIATLVTTFIGKKESNSFHGSLRAPPPTTPTTGGATLHMQGGTMKPVPVASGATPAMDHHTTTTQPPAPKELCFLCESPVDVKFEPCGHAVMCSACGQRAKRCPTCKQPVKTISKLKLVCPMCNEEEASVTLGPCAHEFCPGCARRMRLCFECRTPIETKEGLPPEPSQSEATASSSSAQSCSICLTEPRNTALLCGHQLCWDCAQRVDHCPVCRKFVTHRIRLFQ